MTASDARLNRKLEAIFQAEASEHLERMSSCLAELESRRGEGDEASVQQLFRATHSLKGAARAVGRAGIESVCHAAEGLLAALQRGQLEWSPELAQLLHDAHLAITHSLAADTGLPVELLARFRDFEHAPRARPAREPMPPQAPPLPSAPALEAGTTQTVRVSSERLGRLLSHVEQLMAVTATAQSHATEIDAAYAECGKPEQERLRVARASAWRHQRQLAQAVDRLMSDIKSALLIPAGALSPFVFATVRELSHSLGKQVELRIEGEDVEVDRRVLEELREPLVHLMRNAVAHGIERPADRESAGKPPRGLLQVRIAPRPGAQVAVTVQDDGGGVDIAALARAARERGVDVPQSATEEDLRALMFNAGISTAPGLSAVAGRGIGLSIVRDTVERLGGSIDVTSTAGVGTSFTVTLPVTLATYRVVEVRENGRTFLLPSRQLDKCVLRSLDELQRVGSRFAMNVGEQSIPVASLAELLDLDAEVKAQRSKLHCVLLAAPDRVAVVVDEVVGERDVISKPVAAGVAHAQLVVGAAIIEGDRTAAILNPAELARRALSSTRSSALAPQARESRVRSILVAEDSITSRTLLKNLLEMAGHQVTTAVDGADALRKLRADAFDLLVSDIEMPGLDGIALTRAIRGDAALASLPVVLVTSLGSPADRERGAEAGADAYLVKSDFDQGNLLRTIEELA